ncbi:hypothetical protein BDM02DRAFT_3133401 [Thelephora ganbajun]|uniref:Uncharacterized protein n=1 Tax=Thelephora ganbajun TaxID=370292 RepID=A0ACB6YXR5_THEGA|nr:hypothetical protein BDM02DRAFT_3133401 [Thelephora ganbajun]
MEKLANRKEKADAYVGSMSLIETDPITEELQVIEELEFKVHQLCKEAWGEDPLWYNEEMCPDCKYSISVDDKEITVWDFVNRGNRTFARSELDNPEFNIAEIFASPEPNRTLMSVWEGGYPLLKNYQRWDWPAINWLYTCLSGQLEFVDEQNTPKGIRKQDRIDVQPTMFGYSVQLDELDIIINLMHKEVLNDCFSPEWIINQLLTARNIPAEN